MTTTTTDLHVWQTINAEQDEGWTKRLRVPGGWIYETREWFEGVDAPVMTSAFVPDPPQLDEPDPEVGRLLDDLQTSARVGVDLSARCEAVVDSLRTALALTDDEPYHQDARRTLRDAARAAVARLDGAE